jgi:ABC-type multidrug transport system fused ATPase/permease subunit
VLTGLVEAKVSIARLESFLIHEEVPTNYDEDADEVSVALNGSNGLSKSIGNHKTPHISIKGGSFRWDREHGEPVLHDINLEADHAQLICIVGPVGSGKSSLLNVRLHRSNTYNTTTTIVYPTQVILKEIEKMSGTVSIAGTVSYASQNPFLMNATVRDNILFGKEYDSERYERSINVACMTQDLEMLIAGDLTRIGERGVSLSGGSFL